MHYTKADIEDLTNRQYYEILEKLPQRLQMDDWAELRRFAFLAQVIIRVVGGKEVKITDLIGEPPPGMAAVTTNDEVPAEWLEAARRRGLKTGGGDG